MFPCTVNVPAAFAQVHDAWQLIHEAGTRVDSPAACTATVLFLVMTLKVTVNLWHSNIELCVKLLVDHRMLSPAGLDATPGRGSLESWMAATGLTDITTPAQRGLQASASA